MNRYFTAPCAENRSSDADNVAQIPFFKIGKRILAHIVNSDIDLHPPGGIMHIDKIGLTHVAAAHQPAGDSDLPALVCVKVIRDILIVSVAPEGCDLIRVTPRILQFLQLLAPNPQNFTKILLLILRI